MTNADEENRNAEIFSEMQQDHTEALANLATNTRSDRESASLLSKNTAEITSQIATLTKNLDTANKTIIVLKSGGNRGRGSGAGAGNHNNNDTTDKSYRNVWSRTGRKFDTNGYCSSHGFKVEEEHNSDNCTNECDGNNTTATRMNTKGGIQWNKDWIHEGFN